MAVCACLRRARAEGNVRSAPGSPVPVPSLHVLHPWLPTNRTASGRLSPEVEIRTPTQPLSGACWVRCMGCRWVLLLKGWLGWVGGFCIGRACHWQASLLACSFSKVSKVTPPTGLCAAPQGIPQAMREAVLSFDYDPAGKLGRPRPAHFTPRHSLAELMPKLIAWAGAAAAAAGRGS